MLPVFLSSTTFKPPAVRITLMSSKSSTLASTLAVLSSANEGNRVPLHPSGTTSTRTMSSPTAVTVIVWWRNASLYVIVACCARAVIANIATARIDIIL